MEKEINRCYIVKSQSRFSRKVKTVVTRAKNMRDISLLLFGLKDILMRMAELRAASHTESNTPYAFSGWAESEWGQIAIQACVVEGGVPWKVAAPGAVFDSLMRNQFSMFCGCSTLRTGPEIEETNSRVFSFSTSFLSWKFPRLAT